MKKALAVIFILLVGIPLSLWVAGSQLTAAKNYPIGPAPAELGAESVAFNDIHGWFISANHNQMCVLLLHGVRADRKDMLDRANFLKHAGFSSLLIDLQAHGESQGKQITFGYRESDDAKAAVRYLRQARGCKKVAAIGISLGGAATLLGAAPAKVDALVLESVFPTIEDAITNRVAVYLGKLAPVVAPLLIKQIPYRLHIPLAALRPVDAIKNNHAPVLVMGGSADDLTPPKETAQLYRQALSPKELWMIQGAAHVDFYGFAGAVYAQKVTAFLQKYLLARAAPLKLSAGSRP